MLKNIISNYIANSLLLQRNLSWHRKVLIVSLPAVIIGMALFVEYLIFRIKRLL